MWHNPRRSKSREGLKYLQGKEVEFEVFEYMKEKINPIELAEIIKMSDQPLNGFVRTDEKEYKQLGLNSKELTVEEFARIAAEHPKLLQRPIIIKGDKAVMARPASKIDDIL
ncbi:MAG: ArsC/Spx/MgsR family protein [bacterium]